MNIIKQKKCKQSTSEVITDETAEYTPLRKWIKRREIDENTMGFKNGIENDLEELSKLLGMDLVIMAITPKMTK